MRSYKLLKLLLLIGVLGGFVLALSRTDGSLAAGDTSQKIEDLLMQRFQAEGTTDFIVRFTEQADLSAAYAMEWSQRGWFVYNTLTETAQRSQGNARAYLNMHGLAYRTFIAGNELYVYRGDLENATGLARLGEVANIYAPRTYTIDPGEVVAPASQATWAGDLLASHAEATVWAPDTVTYGIANTNADDFWAEFDVRGEGILIANIDTGVRYTHEALFSKYACGTGPHTNCWYDPDGIYFVPTDSQGHGTHTMGTLVGSDPDNEHQIGMAPNARWIACQGCDGVDCGDVDLLACADWILAPGGSPDNRPHVVNNSWGKYTIDTWFVTKVNAWRAAGIFPAFSAGNNGPDCGTMGIPGAYQESFASAAHDYNYELEYSIGSRGPSFFGHEPYTKPNISAPGVDVTSSYYSYDLAYIQMSGTSHASPHSAGAVALLWSCNPDLIGMIDWTFQLLQDTARTPRLSICGTPPDGEGNYSFGYGYLDAMAAGIAGCGDLVTGTLTGVVYDTQGNPLVGATVSAASPGHSTQAISGPGGVYSLTLVVGTYELSASLNGYKTQTVTDIEIIFHQTTQQDFHLPYLGLWNLLPATPACMNLTRFDAEYYPATELVYILGGRYAYNTEAVDVDTTVGTIFAFNPQTGECADTGSAMPVPISNYTVNLVNDGESDLLCTFGGRKADGVQTRDVQCYHPLTNSVSKAAELPVAFSGYTPGAQVVYNNRVYIFGGLNPTTSPYNLAATYRYDPLDNSFTQLGDLNLARAYIMAAEVDGRIYAFGGDTFDGFDLAVEVKAEVMADPGGAGTWNDAAVADLPSAGAEGRAFGFDSDSDYDLAGRIVLATLAQWPTASPEVIMYDVRSDTYDLDYPNLNIFRRNHAGVFIPLAGTPGPSDGLPGIWVMGGFCIGGGCGGDLQPYAPAEFYPVLLERIYAPLILR